MLAGLRLVLLKEYFFLPPCGACQPCGACHTVRRVSVGRSAGRLCIGSGDSSPLYRCRPPNLPPSTMRRVLTMRRVSHHAARITPCGACQSVGRQVGSASVAGTSPRSIGAGLPTSLPPPCGAYHITTTQVFSRWGVRPRSSRDPNGTRSSAPTLPTNGKGRHRRRPWLSLRSPHRSAPPTAVLGVFFGCRLSMRRGPNSPPSGG